MEIISVSIRGIGGSLSQNNIAERKGGGHYGMAAYGDAVEHARLEPVQKLSLVGQGAFSVRGWLELHFSKTFLASGGSERFGFSFP